jgi:hypothetical protein
VADSGVRPVRGADRAAFKVIYDDANPNRLVREQQVAPYALVGLPKDGLSGAGAVERILTRLVR